MSPDHKDDLHRNGVHTACGPVPRGVTWKGIGDGTHRRCPKAGKVERLHSHDFDGPLVCGCEELL